MNSILKADECIHENFLGWVFYPNEDGVCFLYPQFIFKEGNWLAIDPKAFPNTGSIQVNITNNTALSKIKDEYKTVVVAKINHDTLIKNHFYNYDKEDSSQYRFRFNPALTKGVSGIEFNALSNHRLSHELIQIVDITNNISFLNPIETTIEIEENTDNLSCRTILLRRISSNTNFYGPFEYERKATGGIKIKALAENDFRIMQFNGLNPNDILAVKDRNNQTVCSFIERDLIDAAFKDPDSNELLDWLPQNELIEVISRSIKNSEDFPCSKSQLRNIKTAISSCTNETARINLDEARKKRLVKLLSDVERWIDLPTSIIHDIIQHIDNTQLQELVLDESFFPKIKDKIFESSAIQERVDKERIKLEKDLSSLQDECEQKSKTRASLIEELNSLASKIKDAKKEYEQVQNEALAEKQDELYRLETEKAKLQEEIKQATIDRERLTVDKHNLEKDVNKIIDQLNDETIASSKIIESEIIRKVVSAVSGVKLNEETDYPSTKEYCLHANEDQLSNEEIVDIYQDSIIQRSGRQFSRNDIINFMICLMQGYITTFAGQPGTGKTSLCNILGGTLGLLNDSSRRFTEINVENGWTSYRDYIGYYNPLAKTYERANSSVYFAMNNLSKEHEDKRYPPYIFLLDEANLSPIEHYWAPFLRACDSFRNENTVLSLGGEDVWSMPSHLRFLATVNFDHTTETLSQRFLDRSWVITLDAEDFLEDDLGSFNPSEEFKNEDPFSYNRLTKAFGIKSIEGIDLQVKSLFEDLINTCKQYSFPISPRSQLMMLRYIATASQLMDTQTKDGQFAPLDYAFSQKVLPLIAGPQEKFGELVKTLSEKCSSLKITKKQIDRIKTLGEDSGFYQYFI